MLLTAETDGYPELRQFSLRSHSQCVWERSGAGPTTSLRFTASPSLTPLPASSLLPIFPYTQLQILAHLSRPSSQLSSTLGRTRYFLLLLWPSGTTHLSFQAGLSGNPLSGAGLPLLCLQLPPAERALLHVVLSAPSLPSSSKVISVHLAPHPHSSRDLEAKDVPSFIM